MFSAPLLLESQSEYKDSLSVVYVRICTVTVVYVCVLYVSVVYVRICTVSVVYILYMYWKCCMHCHLILTIFGVR